MRSPRSGNQERKTAYQRLLHAIIDTFNAFGRSAKEFGLIAKTDEEEYFVDGHDELGREGAMYDQICTCGNEDDVIDCSIISSNIFGHLSSD